MSAKEFYNLVADMRVAQIDYQASHTHENLRRVKYLERDVDEEIRRVKDQLCE